LSGSKKLKRCQGLYLTVASEVAAMDYAGRYKLKNAVQNVLKDIEDWRVVSQSENLYVTKINLKQRIIHVS